jgi:hypothetical protein
MTRLPLALAGLGFALMAAIASAQSYSQPNGMPGPGLMSQAGYGPMSQAGYGPMPQSGYGPMPQAGYGPMSQGGYGPMSQAAYGYGPTPSAGMYPSLPGASTYAPPGYASSAYPGAYAPGMVPQGGMMPQGMYPAMAQNPSARPAGTTNQAGGTAPSSPQNQDYHGPQGQIAKANPPPMKLPPGVTCENGLLYYKGSAKADVDYQQFPANNPANSSRSPYRLASYQPGAEGGMGPGATPSVMGPNANYGGGMPAGNAMGYGEAMTPEGAPGGDQGCNQCQDNDQCGGHCGWLYGLFHGSAFPGKLGYVWNAGYDNLAMTRNSGTDRTLLLLDNMDGTFTPIFNADQLEFNWDYGGRAHLELIGPSGITYQAEYTRIATFVTTRTANLGGGNLTLPGPLATFAGFADADSANFFYASAIQTGEFNMIFPFGSFEFLAGYRYMQVDERAQIATISTGAVASFTADSLNVMNGGQVGVLGRWEMFGLVDFDFDAKFAVMGNEARIDQEAIDSTGTPVSFPGVVYGSKTRVAYVTELGLQGVIPLGASFSFHAGYNVYFIDGVALAPDQFDFNIGSSADAGTHVHNHGDIVLQGVNVGLTAVW